MRLIILPAAMLALAACVSPDKQGGVYAVTDHTVTIRGAFSLDGSTAKPTPAMVAQAQAICPGAQYLSASPHDDWTFLYLFRCPNGPRKG